MKKRIALGLSSILILLPIFFELLVIGGVLNDSPNVKLIEFCFKKEQENRDFVEFINVGQGDSTLIKSGNSVAMIDFGVEDDGVKIERQLLRMDVKRIDLAVITHHHRDHMGGFLRVAEKIKIEKLVINNTTAEDGENKLYNEVISVANSKNIELILPSFGQVFKIGSAVLRILSCDSSANAENNRSVVSMLSICGKNFLFTGDCDGDAEYSLSQGCDVECDVLKIGHHGSASSSDSSFLAIAKPEFAIVSCGYDNIYNHPSDDAISRLNKSGAKIYRTDLEGTIRFVFNSGQKNYSVSTERGAA